MKIATFITLLLLVFPIFAASQKSKYVGYKHKGVINGTKLPNGVKDLGGSLLSNEDYGVTRFIKRKKYMLWLEKITSRDQEGVPDWEVQDVLTFKRLKKNQEFYLGLSSPCTLKGRQDLDLIVKAQILPDKSSKILDAWKANLKNGKFESISSKGIKCTMPVSSKK